MKWKFSDLPEAKTIESSDYLLLLDINGGHHGRPKTKKVKVARLSSGNQGANNLFREQYIYESPLLNLGEKKKVNADIAKSALILSLKTSVPSWVRLYSSLDSQTLDENREIDKDPRNGSGLIFEAITTLQNLSIGFSPIPIALSSEVDNNYFMPLSIVNFYDVQSTVRVVLDYLVLEV